jgi:hypothetical protein
MKLPSVERATLPSRKITHYLLSSAHRDGQHKAASFRSFGFRPESGQALVSALLNHAHAGEVTAIVPTPLGQNYVAEGSLLAPDGRTPRVRAVWSIANGQGNATLATPYPLVAGIGDC